MKLRSRIIAGVAAGAMATGLTLTAASPAQAAEGSICALQVNRGSFVTAVGGGGRTVDVMHTNVTSIGEYEKFVLIPVGDGVHLALKTRIGYYVTPENSGGLTHNQIHDVLHTNATVIQNWEKFQFVYQSDGTYGIRAWDGHYLTAVDGGGRTTDTFDTNRSSVNSWEKFRLICGLVFQ